MLRLNPCTLSAALGRQLLLDASHLRPSFEQLLPVFAGRLLDRSLQRANSGSIGLGSALTLFLVSHKRSPRLIAEVGTYIGNSSAAMACGAGLAGQPVHLVTCDLHPCTQEPLAGLQLPQGSGAQVVQGSSTQMFQALASKQAKLDMLHLDGRLMTDDLKLLAQLLKDDTLIALDDCEGDEKGHMNLDLLRRAGLIQQHAFVEPFPSELFRAWNLETRSVTGLLLPLKSISFSRQ
ncbi:class I SAM-dependent methyltransferase [Cyanobium sp. Aljojuca 7D2]|uniref:class I SAM-dependent methyltransferase n=1 Tax=Cyanobium sp. Aljojuca 7D2 TaxID=2823698 RepID=UPI0020CF8DA4|nr:class I SAM-dependent methyltransferase [Cyanobium sp. Aljojuca 7D2]MCP9890252.1 class I SAM-dependent methyltransferase [Cyanobium sp. Aljojuca 7D2]